MRYEAKSMLPRKHHNMSKLPYFNSCIMWVCVPHCPIGILLFTIQRITSTLIKTCFSSSETAIPKSPLPYWLTTQARSHSHSHSLLYPLFFLSLAALTIQFVLKFFSYNHRFKRLHLALFVYKFWVWLSSCWVWCFNLKQITDYLSIASNIRHSLWRIKDKN